ncbi:MAG: RluA family pseudouridine synthase [Lachnospiraceae bacterium]|nr:RluA family pseudouridine synthase [Lachnospiraceae bacterium]
MNRIISYRVSEEENNLELLSFLKKKGLSHQIIVGLKKTPQGITVNDVWAYVSMKLHTNDTVKLFIKEEEKSNTYPPIPFEPDVIYEDEDLLVLNKPANMPIHPSINNYDNTLANGLMYYYQTKTSPFVFRCINRLDKNTTGLTIIAKNPLSAAILARDMKERAIKRTYYAIVCGAPPECGTINAPIGRMEDSLITRKVDFEQGKPAITHYKLIEKGEKYSLIQLVLESGRTHQIRVHMSHIGHPLPGDFIYHPDFTHIDRQPLHAGELSFLHPITKKPLHLTAPLPQDMKQLLTLN